MLKLLKRRSRFTYLAFRPMILPAALLILVACGPAEDQLADESTPTAKANPPAGPKGADSTEGTVWGGVPVLNEDSAEWQAIVDSAREEGELTVYGSAGPLEELLLPLHQSFNDEFGVEVSYLGGERELVERLLAERDTGQQVASGIFQGGSTMGVLDDEGIIAQMTGLPNGARLHPLPFTDYTTRDMAGRVWPVYLMPAGFYLNTELLPKAEAPKSWKELIDPKWKGQIAFHDPARAGGGNYVFTISMKAPGYGEEWNRAFAAQDLLITDSGTDSVVVRQERPIGVPGNPSGVLRQEGTPIDLIIPEDGLIFFSQGMGVVEDGPSPNAALVYFNWLLSPEIQAEIAEGLHFVPAVTGVSHPLGLTPDDVPVLGTGFIGPDDDTVDEAREIYGR